MKGAIIPALEIPTLYTPGEYLELERKAEFRSEYLCGQIYAMAGASREHNLAAGNTFGEIRSQFRGRRCEVYQNDMRVRSGMRYVYPDVVAVCGEPKFEDTGLDTLLNPTVIVEVLSDSTEADDRGEKFTRYRRLPSLQEYVLIAQKAVHVEQFVRQGEQWVLSEMSRLDDVLRLSSIDCAVALRDIYEKIELSNEAEDEPNLSKSSETEIQK